MEARPPVSDLYLLPTLFSTSKYCSLSVKLIVGDDNVDGHSVADGVVN